MKFNLAKPSNLASRVVELVALRRVAPRRAAQRYCPDCTDNAGHSARFTGGVVAARQRLPRHTAAFTLAEVLAALMFMAIVIPVAVQAMHIAATAGAVAERKAAAARVAERVLNETVVMTNWNQASLQGTVMENGREFRWTIRNEIWPQDAMRLLTAEVDFTAQDRKYSVHLSTLVNQ